MWQWRGDSPPQDMPRSDFNSLALVTRRASGLGQARQKYVFVPYRELAYVNAIHAALQSVSWWLSMKWWRRFCGLGCLWKRRVLKCWTTFCTKIIKVRSYWRRMDASLAPSAQSILRFGTTKWRIVLQRAILLLYGVPLTKWLQIFWLNLSRVGCLFNSGMC